MEAVQEVTAWDYPNHTYLLDGNTLVAYIRRGTKTPVYFKSGISGFDRRGRKFVKADIRLFPKTKSSDVVVEVAGSNGNVYYVNTTTLKCSCPGFTYRGECKHVKLALN